MKKMLVVAALLLGVSAEDVDQNCWLTKKDMYMSCHAKNEREPGSLSVKLQECIDLGSDCRGVTCTSDNKCTSRHHNACEGGQFLAKSNDGETTYVKVCDVTKHTWEQHDDKYIPCFAKSEEASGDLLERQMRCAELGSDCVGVTCKYTDATKKADSTKDCTVRDHRAGCNTGNNDALVDNPGEISFLVEPLPSPPGPTPPPTPAPPADENCQFLTHDLSAFPCNNPAESEMGLTYEEATKKCISMKDTKSFCNGIVCKSTDKKVPSCAVHVHCTKQGAKPLKDASTVVHIKRCAEGSWCMDPCHSMVEWKGHTCQNDCDCDGLRHCNTQGFCESPKDMNEYREVCIDDGECKYEKHAHKFMPCQDKALMGYGKMSLAAAQKKCTALRGQCAGITCDASGCELRNHLLEQCDEQSHSLKLSKTEDTYLKCCGPERDLRCPGSSSSSSSHGGVLIFLVVVLLCVVAFLAYKKHQMEKDYVAPNEFNAVPQTEENADGNWIIEDTNEDDQ